MPRPPSPTARRERRISQGLFLVVAVLCSPVYAAQSTGATPSPPLPIEQLGLAGLAAPDAYRLYVADPAMPHIVDGRVHVVDARAMKYLGLLGTGFAGATNVSRDGQTLYVATTYYSRLQRGTRTDVVEAYNTSDLTLRYEVEIPPKHVQSLQMRALMATTADDRFLLVQNATPATSVTVVDSRERKTTSEIALPGCYGIFPWPSQPRRFSAICGDGTFTTVTLDDQGTVSTRAVSSAFFDPDKDPVFMHYQVVGDLLRLVSFHGVVHEIALSGDAPNQPTTWSLVDDAQKKQEWRPGGYQLFAIDPRSQRLYVAMHDHGQEGSHKNPATELWVFDLATHHRVARWPGRAAVSMTVLPTSPSRLVVLTEPEGRLQGFDLKSDAAPTKPDVTSGPIGETPIYLGSR